MGVKYATAVGCVCLRDECGEWKYFAAVLTEQQHMKQLVAAVRAVVSNVKNDDIILALHQYDMDVARTIQALTERKFICSRARCAKAQRD